MNPLVRRVCWRLVGRSVITSCRSTFCVKKTFYQEEKVERSSENGAKHLLHKMAQANYSYKVAML